MAPTPFYLDWTFWTAIVALLALVLSQLPPLYTLFKPAVLEAEAFERILLTHNLGNPGAQLHIVVTNTGGQGARIKSISLAFERGDGCTFELGGRGYFQNASDQTAIIMTPIRLGSKTEWGHIVNFFNYFSREEERLIDRFKSAIRDNIVPRKLMPGNANALLEAPPELVAPAIDFFKSKFKWTAGEYSVTLNIQTERAKQSVARRYRMTIFESEAKQLQDNSERYKYGAGVYYNDSQIEPVFIPLVPA